MVRLQASIFELVEYSGIEWSRRPTHQSLLHRVSPPANKTDLLTPWLMDCSLPKEASVTWMHDL